MGDGQLNTIKTSNPQVYNEQTQADDTHVMKQDSQCSSWVETTSGGIQLGSMVDPLNINSTSSNHGSRPSSTLSSNCPTTTPQRRKGSSSPSDMVWFRRLLYNFLYSCVECLRGSTTRRHTLLVLANIAGWYSISLTLTAVNKVLLDSLAFPYPLAVTFIHFTFVSLALRIFLGLAFAVSQIPCVPFNVYLTSILPISAFSAVEIALSNAAYSMVSLSVITVIKSCILASTYFVSILFGLEVFRVTLLVTLMTIIASVVISVQGMQVNDPIGLVFLSIAVICSSLRWVLVHKQLQHPSVDSPPLSSLQLICLSQCLSALCLAPAVAIIDLPLVIESITMEPVDPPRLCAVLSLLSIAVFLVFGLLFCEFKLIQLTSSLSLTVAGVGKECATICMSSLLFKERLNARAIVGTCVSIVGIGAYSLIRTREALTDITQKPADTPLPSKQSSVTSTSAATTILSPHHYTRQQLRRSESSDNSVVSSVAVETTGASRGMVTQQPSAFLHSSNIH